VLKNLSNGIVAYVMNSAHHLDLRLPNVLDPISVQIGKFSLNNKPILLGRTLETTNIRKWIQQKQQSVRAEEQVIDL